MMFTDSELADLKRCTEIAMAAILQVSTKLAGTKMEDPAAVVAQEWVSENVQHLYRAQAALEREQNRK